MSRQASGLHAWAIQRISAIYVALFVIYLAVHLLFSPPTSYDTWRQWVASPAITVFGAIFFISLLLHAWVGIRDVFIDYVKPIGVRVFLLAALGIGLIGYGAWAARVLFGVVYS